ncbi:hypothetical protein HID58_095018 [Brassica napus]|uniref:Uncharacterized protein n=1 Tax=Brassica napus TaxID=3708 RepID=A0ABQ7X7G8_BRANA|nr:hypothetical protein HID58_095018 [Brassica napus]
MTHQSLKKQWEDLGSCSTVVNRHRYLLTALLLLAFLCTVYLYFAVTLALGTTPPATAWLGKRRQCVKPSLKGNSRTSERKLTEKLKHINYSERKLTEKITST